MERGLLPARGPHWDSGGWRTEGQVSSMQGSRGTFGEPRSMGAEVQPVGTEETIVETSQYEVAAECAMSSTPGLAAGVEKKNVVTDRDHAARVAVDRAREENEVMVITAGHWPQTLVGEGEHSRLAAVKVCPGDTYDKVRAQIERFEAD